MSNLLGDVCAVRTFQNTFIGVVASTNGPTPDIQKWLPHESDGREFQVVELVKNLDVSIGFASTRLRKALQSRCKHCGSMFIEDPSIIESWV